MAGTLFCWVNKRRRTTGLCSEQPEWRTPLSSTAIRCCPSGSTHFAKNAPVFFSVYERMGKFFNEMKEINSIFRVFYKNRSIWTARTGRPSILNTSSLIHPIRQHVGVPNDGTERNTAVRKSGRFPLFRPSLRYSVGTVCRAWASRNASNHSLKCEVCRFRTGR